ncbi:Gfo/Idh/MocA family protein [Nocardia crassostreae]|uniref:Gfo/Idh/MocA family protein n=1 Tax=Nocardia crassostreae TaxID=53428 RepID=UPI00082DBAD0|nr:Gfo/Idh/MocA family oxidoreductase [Nocardia crassostreae]
MKIALLGTSFGQLHAAIYAQHPVEVVVFGRTPSALDELHQRYGFETTTDLDGIFDDPSIDLIDICLPSKLHAELILRGLAAGKHVFSEVPVALNFSDAQRVADAAAVSDREVFVDLHLRFGSAHRRLREAVTAGEHGKLLALDLEVRAGEWPGYDGRLNNITLDTLHTEIDAILHTLGMPESCTVAGADGPVHGSAIHIVLTYPDTVVRISGTTLMPSTYGIRTGYLATFTEGVIEYSVTVPPGQMPRATLAEFTAAAHTESPADQPDPYALTIEHVLACLRGEAANQISPASLLDSLRLTLDIQDAVTNEPHGVHRIELRR